jgi:hypothetical protein
MYSSLFTLIRYGSIEVFETKFGIGPSCAVVGNGFLLGYNLTLTIKLQLAAYLREDTKIGICIYDNNKYVYEILINNKIPVSQFILINELKKIKPLSHIIRSTFNKVEISSLSDNKKEILDGHGKWTSVINCDHMGLYRFSMATNSNVFYYVLRTSKKETYAFRSEEFEKHNIARIYSNIIRNDKNITPYKLENNTVLISDRFFPILLERLLLINKWIRTGSFCTNHEYYLNNKELVYLQNIFE